MRYAIASVAALGLAAFVAAQSPAGAQNQGSPRRRGAFIWILSIQIV